MKADASDGTKASHHVNVAVLYGKVRRFCAQGKSQSDPAIPNNYLQSGKLSQTVRSKLSQVIFFICCFQEVKPLCNLLKWFGAMFLQAI